MSTVIERLSEYVATAINEESGDISRNQVIRIAKRLADEFGEYVLDFDKSSFIQMCQGEIRMRN